MYGDLLSPDEVSEGGDEPLRTGTDPTTKFVADDDVKSQSAIVKAYMLKHAYGMKEKAVQKQLADEERIQDIVTKISQGVEVSEVRFRRILRNRAARVFLHDLLKKNASDYFAVRYFLPHLKSLFPELSMPTTTPQLKAFIEACVTKINKKIDTGFEDVVIERSAGEKLLKSPDDGEILNRMIFAVIHNVGMQAAGLEPPPLHTCVTQGSVKIHHEIYRAFLATGMNALNGPTYNFIFPANESIDVILNEWTKRFGIP